MTSLAFFYGPLHVSLSDCLDVFALFVESVQHGLHVFRLRLPIRGFRARHTCLLHRAWSLYSFVLSHPLPFLAFGSKRQCEGHALLMRST